MPSRLISDRGREQNVEKRSAFSRAPAAIIAESVGNGGG
jgi:hypothetical protein